MMKTTLLLACLLGVTIAMPAVAGDRYHVQTSFGHRYLHSDHVTVTVLHGDRGYLRYSDGYVLPRRTHERVIIHHAPPIRYVPFGIRRHDHRYDHDRYDRFQRFGHGRYDRHDHYDRHDNRRTDHRDNRSRRNHYK